LATAVGRRGGGSGEKEKTNFPPSQNALKKASMSGFRKRGKKKAARLTKEKKEGIAPAGSRL